MRRLTLPTIFVCLATLLVAICGSASAAPRSPLTNEGRWITDAKGRVTILHGVNMVYKVGTYEPSTAGFGANDARFLKRHGFNTVRLGVIYKGVEPNEPRNGKPRYSHSYLHSIAETQKLLANDGIFTLLDFHQDLYNERFQGEGWPNWQVLDDGLPSQPQQGFPNNYLVNVGLNRAFDNFWSNEPVGSGSSARPIQSAYGAAWRHVAKRFANSRHVLGYDLLNEPWPGSVFPSCASTAGCPAFDTGVLNAFNQTVLNKIRQVDRSSLVFYEPNVLFDFGSATSLPPTGDPHTALSFHDYCLQQQSGAEACKPTEELVFDNADDATERTGDPQLLTEFSATTDQQTNRNLTEMADAHMVGWQIWHYCECDDPTTSGPGLQSIVHNAHKPPSGKNVNHQKLKTIERPYPQAVAGTPKDWSFDPATKRFDLNYSLRAPSGHPLSRKSLTEVYLPRIQYGRGYRVRVRGAQPVSKPGARILKLERGPSTGKVHLRVLPVLPKG